MRITAGSHGYVHTITNNSNGMDLKSNEIGSDGMNTFCVFHVNNMLSSTETVMSIVLETGLFISLITN